MSTKSQTRNRAAGHKRHDPRYTAFMADAQAVSQRRHSPLAGLLLGLIASVTMTAVAWASLAEVDRVVLASGQVRPVERVNVINHTDGGSVSKVYVREGDRVVPDQPLVELDRKLIAAELSRLVGEGQALEAEVSRLAAEARGSEPGFSAALMRGRPDLVRAQRQLFAARKDTLATSRRSSAEAIHQRQGEVDALLAKAAKLQAEENILALQIVDLEEATKKGLYPKLQLLSMRRDLNSVRGNIEENQQQLVSARAALAEARARHEGIGTEWREQVMTDLESQRRELESNVAQVRQYREKLINTLIRAPIAGVVNGLAVSNIGQAVGANEPLMHIVPDDGQLLIEAQVGSDEIGHVQIGQAARIKVRTYDFVRYGTLDGVVERIAADAAENEDSHEQFYVVAICSQRTYLGEAQNERSIIPGMVVDVELKTGMRTILSYFTDRMTATADAAFKER